MYAKDKEHLAGFHAALLGMSRVYETAEIRVLQSSGIQLLIHRMPANTRAEVAVEQPPRLRDAALKFFFTVDSLSAVGSIARRLGGGVDDAQWDGTGFVVRNAHDPEGNVFHLRETRA